MSREEHKDAIEVRIIFHEGQRMFAVPKQPAPVQTADIAALVEGMEVSIDVSTGDHDSGNRLFGSVTMAQENQGSKHGLILLVQDPEANFKTTTPSAQPAPVHFAWMRYEADCAGDPVLVLARSTEEGAFKVYKEPPAAQPAPVPLTARELELIDGMIEVQLDHAKRCDSIANRTMAERQKGWDMERVALLQKLKGNNT